MYTVIKLEPKGNRWHVYLDNDIDFLLYKSEVRKLNLVQDARIEEKQYEIIVDTLYKRARERALYILDDAYKTKNQIIDKLKAGCYPEFIIDKVVGYLVEYDLINDDRYASMYIDFKASSKSKRQIVQDLYLKGLSKETIDSAFENNDFSEEDSLKKIIEKRKCRYDLTNQKDIEKFYRYLIGKGYPYHEVKRVLSLYNI